MTDLTSPDMRALLESISILNSDLSESSLPSRVIRAISNCISVEIIGLDRWKKSGEFAGIIRYEPNDWVTAEATEAFVAHVAEHPLLLPLVFENYPQPLKISDYLTSRQFHRTGLYNEFYKRVGVHEQLIAAFDVAKGTRVTVALNRSRRDFSERDREMLRLLSPHLAAAFKNTAYLNDLLGQNLLLQRHSTKGLVVLDGKGNAKFVSELAEKHLQTYFPDRGSNVLPDVLKRYVTEVIQTSNGQEYFEPTAPFRTKRQSSELQVRVMFDLKAEEVRLLLQETAGFVPDEFRPLRLTKREAEILCWIAEGKTDDVIGELCFISPRTVQKHVEHIMQKLNAETRTAAVRYALDTLGLINGNGKFFNRAPWH